MMAERTRLTRQQCWALAMREGMLTDGWTTIDVRARYAQLLAEHGLSPTEDGGR